MRLVLVCAVLLSRTGFLLVVVVTGAAVAPPSRLGVP